MQGFRQTGRMLTAAASSLLALSAIVSTGCQVDVAGQTLPSSYYMYDDVQYYAKGPEFKLANEAAALKAAQAEREEAE